jgi:hypothetical protein
MAGVYSDVRKAIRKAAISSLLDFFPNTVAQDKYIIFSNNNGTEPDASYAVINILSIEQQGHHSKSSLLTVDEKLVFQVAYEIMCQFSFIGSLSGDLAQIFTQNINNNPLALEELKNQKLGLMRKSQIRRAPQKRDTKWVEYHNMDVTFNYVVITNQLVDVVEGVVIEENLDETLNLIKLPESIIYP